MTSFFVPRSSYTNDGEDRDAARMPFHASHDAVDTFPVSRRTGTQTCLLHFFQTSTVHIRHLSVQELPFPDASFSHSHNSTHLTANPLQANNDTPHVLRPRFFPEALFPRGKDLDPSALGDDERIPAAGETRDVEAVGDGCRFECLRRMSGEFRGESSSGVPLRYTASFWLSLLCMADCLRFVDLTSI